MADEVSPKSLWDTIKEPQMIVTLWITGQFFLLIVGFGCGVLKLANDTVTVILQTYTVAFTAAWGYWLGSSSGSKAKDAIIKGVPANDVQGKAGSNQSGSGAASGPVGA